MKNLVKQRLIATIIVLFVAVGGTFGQLVTNAQLAVRPANNTSAYDASKFESTATETVTTGAQMPYYVGRDKDVNGSFFNLSQFKWSWSGITSLKDSTDSDITSLTDTKANRVVAIMPAAGTSTSISVSEVSKPKAGIGCDGDPTTINITVVAKPTLSFTEGSSGGCAAGAVNLDLNLVGNAPFYVDYTITAVDIDGNAIGSSKTYNATLADATTDLLIDPTQLLDVAGAALATDPQTPGKYTVTITKVWDKYSWKAINYDALAVSPLATADNYDIYVYPKPATQQIQHIKNL